MIFPLKTMNHLTLKKVNQHYIIMDECKFAKFHYKYIHLIVFLFATVR